VQSGRRSSGTKHLQSRALCFKRHAGCGLLCLGAVFEAALGHSQACVRV